MRHLAAHKDNTLNWARAWSTDPNAPPPPPGGGAAGGGDLTVSNLMDGTKLLAILRNASPDGVGGADLQVRRRAFGVDAKNPIPHRNATQHHVGLCAGSRRTTPRTTGGARSRRPRRCSACRR